ncbi:MAG TPA: class I SAM-dependent methyltransferase [Candidatus Rifleibacterium sp.]|nr:class I SAM-dependent methyltransferase [Candidatus Rifleibacterium sp.]HPT47062.1 class I SAM-dependent methyltransferase [Candidatus Rifleibacterium sp.]
MKNNPTAAVNWNRFWQIDHNPGQKLSWSKRRIINLLKPYVKSGARVIDAGCGSGFFSNHFNKNLMQVLALDYADSALALCRKNCSTQVRVEKFDLLHQSLGEHFGQNFNLVFSDGLLEHFSVKDQLILLRNFAEATTPGGRIINFVPNRFSPWQLIRPLLMPGIEETPFILKNLIRLHHLAGLRVIDAGGINVLPVSFSPEICLGKCFGMLLYTVSEVPDT